MTAFVGPAPRGPVHTPIHLRSLAEYQQVFGVPGQPSAMCSMLQQYFASGGQVAVVVRVPGALPYARLLLTGPAGPLALVALSPGPFEWLRAAVDHEGLDADPMRFNLTVQRLTPGAQPMIEAQEIHRALSVDPGDPRHAGLVLQDSSLVRLSGYTPARRPAATPANGLGWVRSVLERPSSAAITDYDLLGSRADGFGLMALDTVDMLDFVCLLPGAPDAAIGPVALFAAERWCRERSALLLVDPPPLWREPEDALRAQRERGLSSPDAVTYFPRRSASAGSVDRGSILGALAGCLARDPVLLPGADHAGPLRATGRPALELDPWEPLQLGRAGINALLAHAGQLRVEGLVTLAGHGRAPRRWQSLAIRANALRVTGDISRATRWLLACRGQPDAAGRLRAQLAPYLDACREAGRLVGTSPEESWFLESDPSEPLAFTLGLALEQPDRFAVFRFRHGVSACSIDEQAAREGYALAV